MEDVGRFGDQVSSLTDELSAAAEISRDDAARVLEVLRVERLVENVATMQSALQDEALTKALGYHAEHADSLREAVRAENLRLENVGLTFKTPGMLGSQIPV